MDTTGLTNYRRKLPHWRDQGAIYFITWRLAKNQPPLEPDERTLCADAIRHFNRRRYELFACVVMDDHVHVLMLPLRDHLVAQILHSWKSFTANGLATTWNRAAPIWQDEYFDRKIRDDAELIQKAEYILGNPGKRWPELQGYPWVWCDHLKALDQ